MTQKISIENVLSAIRKSLQVAKTEGEKFDRLSGNNITYQVSELEVTIPTPVQLNESGELSFNQELPLASTSKAAEGTEIGTIRVVFRPTLLGESEQDISDNHLKDKSLPIVESDSNKGTDRNKT